MRLGRSSGSKWTVLMLVAVACTVPESDPLHTPRPDLGVELQPLDEDLYPDLAPEVRVRIRRAEELVRVAADADRGRLAAAWGELGRVQHAFGALTAAETSYENAMKLTPEDLRWRTLGAYTRLELGATNEALAHLQEVELAAHNATVPSWSATQRAAVSATVADLMLAQSRLIEAREAYQRVLENAPDSAAAFYGLGQVAQLEERHQEAVSWFERSLAAAPKANRVHFPLAMSLRALGRIEDAQAHLALRGERVPGLADPLRAGVAALNPSTLARSGARALERGAVEAALYHLERAAKARPADSTVRHNYGVALLAAGRLEAATREFDSSLELGERGGQVHLNRGLALLRLERHAEAAQAFSAGLREDPELLELRFGLGRAYLASGQLQAARRILSDALVRDPSRNEIRLQLAIATARLGDLDEARALARSGVPTAAGYEALEELVARIGDRK